MSTEIKSSWAGRAAGKTLALVRHVMGRTRRALTPPCDHRYASYFTEYTPGQPPALKRRCVACRAVQPEPDHLGAER